MNVQFMKTNNTFELLVDKIDGTLSPEGLQQTELLIKEEPAVASELATLEMVVANVREAGIYEQVSGIARKFQAAGPATEQAPVISMAFVRKLMKVAAVIILIGISATVFKFMSVTEDNMYADYYSSYNLNTSRSQGTIEQMEAAYRNHDWQGVLNVAKRSSSDNKELFLIAMANMELKQFNDAVPAFQGIIQRADNGTDKYFLDEAQYYLAICYLALKETKLAIPALEAIAADKQHLFNARVVKMNMDLKILKLKKG
jgi:tetratricopeptide (TPR) repeat protein